MLKWIIVGSFVGIGILAMSGFPVEMFFCKEMLGIIISFAVLCVFIHNNFFIKEIVKEFKEIVNEE